MNKLLYRTTGRYYLGKAEEQAQYVFQFREDAPKNLQRSFLVELEKDGSFTGSALEVAHAIKEVIDSYWYNTDTKKIQDVVDYLEKWSEKDKYDGLIEEITKMEKRLSEIKEELSFYDQEEMCNWKPDDVDEQISEKDDTP